jgi:hypothetical protein
VTASTSVHHPIRHTDPPDSPAGIPQNPPRKIKVLTIKLTVSIFKKYFQASINVLRINHLTILFAISSLRRIFAFPPEINHNQPSPSTP